MICFSKISGAYYKVELIVKSNRTRNVYIEIDWWKIDIPIPLSDERHGVTWDHRTPVVVTCTQ